MPGDSLQQLLDRYGGDMAAGHYGAAVIGTVDDVVSMPGVSANVSPITEATIATLEVAAYEVLSGGASLEALAKLAVGTAMDVAGQLAAEALEAVTDVVPVMAGAFRFLVGLQAAAAERERASRIAQARADFAACQAEADGWAPIGTGPFSETYPCDLFLQASPGPGGWEHADPIRVPYLGQMLQLMTETRWPGWLLHYVGGAAADPRTWGYQDGPAWRSLVGSELYPFDRSRPSGVGPWFPELDWYVSAFGRLRLAIRSMHPLARQLEGLPPGDGGKSLWALYQDLLWAALDVPRHPFTRPGEPPSPIKDHTNFSALVPPLPRAAADAMYGGQIKRQQDGEPYSLGRPPLFDAIDYIRGQGGRVDAQPGTDLCAPCTGQPAAAVEAIYAMAGGWNLYAYPLHLTDQIAQKAAIRECALFASEFAKQRLRALGLAPASGQSRQDATQAVAGLETAGLVSPHQAQAAADAMRDGASPARLAAYLGAAGLGLSALSWVL